MQTQETQYFYNDLKHGEAIRYWQLSGVTEQRYDVAPQPMKGDMDPFFFLSKKKNFIPHEYPCRTEFKRDFVGKRPSILGQAAYTCWWMPFGSDRVDLSGFWFRATRVAAWARTTIDAAEAGEACLRLGTCGGAILFVQGKEVAWTAEYQRNFETRTETTVRLEKGLNEIVIYFDDLAERDIRFFFQLDYVSGVKARVACPVPVAADLAGRIEAMLDGMAFDRSAYFAGDITLRFPQAAPVDIQVRSTVSGDFVSLEPPVILNATLKAGQTDLVLTDIAALPADFRNFMITCTVGAFTTSRRIGVEICHMDRMGKAPQDQAARVDEALAYVARFGELSSVKALARLASGLGGHETDAMIEAVLPSVQDCHDCADFTLVPLLWCRIRHAKDIAPAVLRQIDETLLNFRYWMDEPGNDVQWYFSENHALLFHTSAYLAGALLPEATFVRSGRKGAAQSEAGRARILAWLDHFEQCEMAEWNSAPYFPIDLKGLTALAGLGQDDDIRARALRAIARLIEQIARSSYHGLMTASQGRSYEHTLRAGRSLELSGIARLMWGKGWYGARFHAIPQLAILLREGVLKEPAELARIADYQGDGALEWHFAQGQNRIAKLYHYKTRHAAMGSIAGYRWGEWGYQESPMHLRIGEKPEAQIWINHPGETIQGGFGRPSYWGGCGSLPRIHQYRGLAVLDFSAHESQPDFSHAWLPVEEFDKVSVDGNVIIAQSGEGMVLLAGNTAFERVTEGPTQQCEVRLPGAHTRWLVRLCDDESLAGLPAFRARFGRLTARDEGDRIVVEDPTYGTVVFFADGRIEAQGRVLDPQAWTIRGESRTLGRP